MNPEDNEVDKDMMDKARQLLLLTDLVDKYPTVMAKRVAGLVYLIIAGGMSFATLIFMALQDVLGHGDPLLVNLGFIVLSLLFSWIVAFRLVLPLTSSYPKAASTDENGRAPVIVWGILVVAMVVSSYITFSIGMGDLFVPILQIIMGVGFLSNYILGRRDSSVDFYTHEHLIFAILIFLSIVPILMFVQYGFIILIVVNMGGIYVIGIYLIITSERLLLESKGQG